MLYQINAICWKKNSTQSKNSNKKLTLGFLYEMVFVWNIYNSSAHVCKTSGTSYKKSLFEVTPMLLYEVVSLVRSGLCSKWSLYEVTWHPLLPWYIVNKRFVKLNKKSVIDILFIFSHWNNTVCKWSCSTTDLNSIRTEL